MCSPSTARSQGSSATTSTSQVGNRMWPDALATSAAAPLFRDDPLKCPYSPGYAPAGFHCGERGTYSCGVGILCARHLAPGRGRRVRPGARSSRQRCWLPGPGLAFAHVSVAASCVMAPAFAAVTSSSRLFGVGGELLLELCQLLALPRDHLLREPFQLRVLKLCLSAAQMPFCYASAGSRRSGIRTDLRVDPAEHARICGCALPSAYIVNCFRRTLCHTSEP